jgi:LysM repeat protein
MMQRRLSPMIALAVTIALAAGCNFPTREPPPQPLSGNAVIVQEGQSIYDIASLHGVSAEQLAAANGVLPPYRLTAGQVLQLPQQGAQHTVQSGDTLLSIARANQVDADQIAAVNGLAPPYTIYPGQVLTLPSNVPPPQIASSTGEWGAQGQAPVGVASSAPLGATGTTPPYGTSASASAGGSGGTSGSVTAVALEPLPPPPGAAPQSEEPAAELPAQEETAVLMDTEVVEDDPPQAEPVSVPAAPASTPSEAFQWPVIGEVLSDFGQKSDGSHNDGLNIAAPRGAPVRASRGGEIAYSG